MISKEELKSMVETICFKSKQSQEDLAVSMGYGKTYISEMLTARGSVTKKFVNKLRLQYGYLLENPKHNSHKIESAEADYNTQKSQPLEGTGLNITLKDYIEEIKNQKTLLGELLKIDRARITASLDTILDRVLDASRVQIARTDEMMKALDQLTKQPEGTLSERADKTEQLLKDADQVKYNLDGVGIDGKG